MKLKPLRLAFVAKHPASRWYRWPLPLIGAAALSLAILAGLESHADLSAARERKARQESQSARYAAPLRNAEEQRPLRAQIKAINAHIRGLNLPWDEIFRTLRPGRPGDVRLLSLDASAGAAAATLLHIRGEADGPDKMTAYAAYLAHQPRLQNVTLVHHETGREAGAVPGSMRFRLEASWLDSL